jgi:hypothetical protein
MLARQELGADLGEQQWLFRQGDLVLGPLSGQQLVEKLFTGEMTADTLVAPPGAREFKRMGDVEAFKVHVARAQTKAKVDAEVRADRARVLRKRMIIGGIVAAVTVALGIAAWQVARYAAVHGPGGEEDEYAGITMELPTITLAQARKDDDDLIAYPTNTPRPPPDKTGTEVKPKPPGSGTATPPNTAVASAKTPDKKPGGTGSSEPDGLQMGAEFDQKALTKVVKSNERTLFRCLKEEAERQPGLFAKVPIEFVVGNDGKVSKLYVDNPQFKKGPLYDCMLLELQKWPFKPYNGERASVGLNFTVGKRG